MSGTRTALVAGMVCAALAGTFRAWGAEEPSPAPAPPQLLGIVTAEQILAITPEWKANHDAYEPGVQALIALHDAAAAATGDLSIEVIFGSWCSDSREQIPRFIKVLEQAGAGGIPVTWRGVHKARDQREQRVAQLRITAIPTIIVSRKGSEIGRIVETPQASIEEDLAAVLKPR